MKTLQYASESFLKDNLYNGMALHHNGMASSHNEMAH